MTKYETVYVLDPSFDEARAGEEADRVSGWIKDLGGEVVEVQKWGKRRLAYEINRKVDGYYVVFQARALPAPMVELHRVLSLADEVIRHKVLRIPAKVYGPPRVAGPVADRA